MLRVAPIDEAGQLDLEQFEKLLNPRTRLLAITHMSNALGTINPVKPLGAMAHRVGAVVLVDGAQAVAHLPVNVGDLGCDFYAFSGHKLYGPTGTGVLYGRAALAGGGDMIRQVSFAGSSWNDLPYKFEAGTPNIAGGIALGVAIDYLQAVGWRAIAAHEADLLHYATGQAQRCDGLRLIGTAGDKGAILSFTLAGIHPHDIGTILDAQGVAVRTGHHCAMPVMECYRVLATVRASFALYNTRREVDALFGGLRKVREMFA